MNSCSICYRCNILQLQMEREFSFHLQLADVASVINGTRILFGSSRCARSGPCFVCPCPFPLFCAASAAVRAPFVPASFFSAARAAVRASLVSASCFCSVQLCSLPFVLPNFSQEVSLSIVFLAAGPLTRTRHRAAAWVSFWTNLKEARAEER